MAKGARYRVPFRRRREGKTNYHLRRRLVRSNETRAVVRLTNNHCLIQFIDARINGDFTLSSAHTRELTKEFQWGEATSNIPSAYLVGFLAGLKGQKAGIQRAILDAGLNPPVYGSRLFAALKGIVDSGLEVPHSEKVFPTEERLKGRHIAEYARILKQNDMERFEIQFSKYIKQKIDPTKLTDLFENTKNAIETKYH
ncbi:MAG: 50S ribosomal protein L18 [Candidatus Thorarchaeota archaeon]